MQVMSNRPARRSRSAPRSRRPALTLAALIACLGVFGFALVNGSSDSGKDGAGAGGNSAPSGSPATSAAAQSRDLQFGLAYSYTLPGLSADRLEKAFSDANELGVSWIRTDFNWAYVQPDGPDSYHWDQYDRVFEAAARHKLKVLATVSYTPRWAGDPSCAGRTSCPPANADTFARFTAAAAARYAHLGLHTWEIWNEPNHPSFWSSPDAQRYVSLLKATSTALRQTDDKAFILLGGLAVTGTDAEKGGRISHLDFLERTLRLGAARYVDAVSYHPFGQPTLPSTETAEGTVYQQIDRSEGSIVDLLKQHNAEKLQIWLTETGAPTNGPGAAADSERGVPHETHLTERFQGVFAADVVHAAADIDAVDVVFWYAYQDTRPPSDNEKNSQFYGLLRYDGTRKPSFDAFKGAIAKYHAEHAQ